MCTLGQCLTYFYIFQNPPENSAQNKLLKKSFNSVSPLFYTAILILMLNLSARSQIQYAFIYIKPLA